MKQGTLSHRPCAARPATQAAVELRLPRLVFRAASSREATPDLQQPVFNDSVVPLILYPTWQENYGTVGVGRLANLG